MTKSMQIILVGLYLCALLGLVGCDDSAEADRRALDEAQATASRWRTICVISVIAAGLAGVAFGSKPTGRSP